MSLPNISRKVCCIISSKNDLFLREIVYKLETEEINNVLRRETCRLGNAMQAELRRMVIKNYTAFDESEIVGTFKADELRFIIHDQNRNPQGGSLCKNNSHVVEISTSAIDDLTETSFDYRFYVQNDSFVYLIVDVMFDIQMFYFYNLDKKFDTVEKKRLFSTLKVDFCKELTIGSRFNRSNEFTKYCSFAFFCRDSSNKFNYNKYLDMWSDFVAEINADRPFSKSEDIAREIIKSHAFGAQLSYRKLKNLLRKCRVGETYELVRIYKKPKSKHMKKRVGALFGKKKIRVGLFKIIPRRLKYQYIKYGNYIDVFEFTA